MSRRENREKSAREKRSWRRKRNHAQTQQHLQRIEPLPGDCEDDDNPHSMMKVKKRKKKIEECDEDSHSAL